MEKYGLLGSKQRANIGKSVIITPSLATVGLTIFQQDFSVFPTLAAEPDYQWDDENISVAIQATPLNSRQDANLGMLYLYAVFNWQAGSSLFGLTQDPLVALGSGLTITPDVLVDIQGGIVLTIPAAVSLTMKIRCIAIVNPAFAGFAGNAQFAPSFRINYGVSYGNINPPSTLTQTIPALAGLAKSPTFAPTDSALIQRPPFAQECCVLWNDSVAAGPVTLDFFQSISGVRSNFVSFAAPYQQPPPRIPWPADSGGVEITNGSAAPINSVKLINYLAL